MMVFYSENKLSPYRHPWQGTDGAIGAKCCIVVTPPTRRIIISAGSGLGDDYHHLAVPAMGYSFWYDGLKSSKYWLICNPRVCFLGTDNPKPNAQVYRPAFTNIDDQLRVCMRPFNYMFDEEDLPAKMVGRFWSEVFTRAYISHHRKYQDAGKVMGDFRSWAGRTRKGWMPQRKDMLKLPMNWKEFIANA